MALNNDKAGHDLENGSPPSFTDREKRKGSLGGSISEERGRRMSRFDRSIEDAEADSEFGIGAQIELEKENAIKYRTCSWQKVRLPSCVSNCIAISSIKHTFIHPQVDNIVVLSQDCRSNHLR